MPRSQTLYSAVTLAGVIGTDCIILTGREMGRGPRIRWSGPERP